MRKYLLHLFDESQFFITLEIICGINHEHSSTKEVCSFESTVYGVRNVKPSIKQLVIITVLVVGADALLHEFQPIPGFSGFEGRLDNIAKAINHPLVKPAGLWWSLEALALGYFTWSGAGIHWETWQREKSAGCLKRHFCAFIWGFIVGLLDNCLLGSFAMLWFQIGFVAFAGLSFMGIAIQQQENHERKAMAAWLYMIGSGLSGSMTIALIANIVVVYIHVKRK